MSLCTLKKLFGVFHSNEEGRFIGIVKSSDGIDWQRDAGIKKAPTQCWGYFDKSGDDLLSHVLRQYHRRWRA